MKFVTALSLGIAIGLTGCGSSPPSAKGDSKQGHGKTEHVHGKGPHGGEIFDLGKYHGELSFDNDKKEVTLYILGSDEKTLSPVTAKNLTITTKVAKTKDGKDIPAMTIKMLPQDEANGKASKFVGTDPGLANDAEYEGTASGELDGKPAAGDFK
ncbi:MAG: hypothetical protein ACJ8C4_11485 [Gemmataceae bacterium]